MKKIKKNAAAWLYDTYRNDWVFCVEHFLRHWTWSGQREIIQSVQENQFTVVAAAHGMSKTYTAAELVILFFNLFPDCKIITTAPIKEQVTKLLWMEIRTTYSRSVNRLIGKVSKIAIIDPDKNDHQAWGFTTENQAQAEGVHAPRIFWVLDEAKGIQEWVWAAMLGSLTGGFSRVLAISTTDGAEYSEFVKCFDKDSGYNTIVLPAFASPFVTGEKFRTIQYRKIKGKVCPDNFFYIYENPLNLPAQLASPAWIEKIKKDHGKNSYIFLTKVLAQFPNQGFEADSIIDPARVEQMFKNWTDPNFNPGNESENCAGIDVAWGISNTVVWWRKGNRILKEPLIITGKELKQQENKQQYQIMKIAAYLNYDFNCRLKVDQTGGGSGIIDGLKLVGFKKVFNIKTNGSSYYSHFANLPSEIWVTVAEKIHHFACPKSSQLRLDLCRRKLSRLTTKGKTMVESKADYQARTGSDSPDVGDALLYCIWNPPSLGKK